MSTNASTTSSTLVLVTALSLVLALLAVSVSSTAAVADHDDDHGDLSSGPYSAFAGIKPEEECLERERRGCAFSQLKCCSGLYCAQHTDAEGLQSSCVRPLCIPWRLVCINTDSCCLGYTCRKSNDKSLFGRCDY